MLPLDEMRYSVGRFSFFFFFAKIISVGPLHGAQRLRMAKQASRRVDYAPLLNRDILSVVFSYMTLDDLPTLALVCKIWSKTIWTSVRRICFRSLATNLRAETMEHFLKRCVNAVHIDLSLCDNALQVLRGVQFMRRASQLRSLHLTGCTLSSTVLADLCGRLSSLHVLQAAEVAAFGAPLIRSLALVAPGLTRLDVSRTATLNDELLVAVALATRLRSLALDSGIEVTPTAAAQSLRSLGALGRLTDLSMARVGFTDAAFASAVRSWPRLRRLALYHCPRLGHLSLDSLARSCTDLVKLSVWEAPELLDEAVLRFANRATALTSLRLYDTGVNHTLLTSLRISHKRIKIKGEGKRR